MSDRYVVVPVTGYLITPGPTHSTGRQATSLSVLDSAHCYREVFRQYSRAGRYEYRARRAYAECARLNALDDLQSVVAA